MSEAVHLTPLEALLCATATNVLSVRKRSDSNKCFICAKAKRQQQQMFSVAKAKRSVGTEINHTYW
ncbi:hypothetical protein [Lysinibacillus sp. fls2-241-R2A-57]|uniref:hypothetical protein n=1 Tax=Lysinibacillus sp. fls2-241-R2A-57 TaxID=3040292 RepID=UPI0025523C18|nr:hypothetical protein [Lysinibacillus sp. fls2-241-R2A-57]